jgi:peptidyl-dipeptidase Dcp
LVLDSAGQLDGLGDSVDPLAAFRNFRGHDPEIGPLLERRGLR